MASNREYKIRHCENPECQFGRYFSPHDKRQKFCRRQCRINYFNDKRSLQEKSLKAHLKKVEEQDNKLSILYDEMRYRSSPIEAVELGWYEIDRTVGKKEKMVTSSKEILWFNSYGLIKLNRKGTHYQIICRNHIK